jgi:hypothetical protein
MKKYDKFKQWGMEDIVSRDKRCLRQLDELVEDERNDAPVWGKKLNTVGSSHCKAKMAFDIISGKFFCPECDVDARRNIVDTITRFGEQNKITPSCAQHLKFTDSETLAKIILLRDNRYNYLYNEWQLAVKSDRKSEFFLQQLYTAKQEIHV